MQLRKGIVTAATAGFVAGAVLAGALGAPAAPIPDAPKRAKYVTTNDAEPYRIVIRGCGTGEDSWAHLKLVDFSGDTTTYRCKHRGY